MRRIGILIGLTVVGCGGGGLNQPPAGMGGAAGAASLDAGTGGSAGTRDGSGGALAGTGGSAGSGAGATGGVGAAGNSGNGGVGGTAGNSGAGGDPSCHTTISGTVFDPAGTVPLYGVVVYVPSAPPTAMPDGISCALPQRCPDEIAPTPLALTLTDASGDFTLTNVPNLTAFTNVPLVIETGKWRREILIPSVTPCAATPVAHDLTRLPRNRGEGHMPRIAVVTGHADALECVLRNIGIADSEFTSDGGAGRVHLFHGGAGNSVNQGALGTAAGDTFADAYTALFAVPAKMAQYDYILLSCEGSVLQDAKSPYVGNVRHYADGGGRLFLQHLQSTWVSRGLTPWPSTATWAVNLLPDLPPPVTGLIETTFPRGAALASWLTNIGATSIPGQITLLSPQHSVDAPVAAGTQIWLTTMAPNSSIQHLSFRAPVESPATEQCGRVDFSDLHAGSGAGVSHPETPFPTGCATAAPDAQQRLWEYLFFDLNGCVRRS